MNEAPRARHAQLLDDVTLNLRGCGRGQADDRGRLQAAQPVFQHAIVGAKVMAPLGNAVGFVDRDQHGLAAREHFGKARNTQAFGGDE